MKYLVDVNGQRVTVDLSGDQVRVGDTVVEASLLPIEGTSVRLIRVGDQVHRVVARRGGTRGAWQLDLDGVRVEADALDERMRAIRDLTAAKAAAGGPAPIIAPMPGLVVRVAVGVGDQVQAGQGVCAIEAMKMENELRAPAAGVVMAIRAIPGQAVDKGTVLIELGPLPG